MKQLFGILFVILAFSPTGNAQSGQMAKVEGGTYLPLYGTGDSVSVESFEMDILPVTNAEFLEFVRENEEWRKSRIKGFFAEDTYLEDWQADLELGEKVQDDWPVVNVSWHAAKEYCECQGKRLPTVHEWEYAAMADENQPDARDTEAYTQYILSWYETPRAYQNEVGNTYENYWGIYDLHGLIWEWNQDFNTVMLVSDSEVPGAENALFCDPGAASLSDMINYAAYMRFAFRATLDPPFTSRNLGFRCVRDVPKEMQP